MKIRLRRTPLSNGLEKFDIEVLVDESNDKWELFKFPIDYGYDKSSEQMYVVSSITSDEFKVSSQDIISFFDVFKSMDYVKRADGIDFYYKLKPKEILGRSAGLYPGEFSYIGYVESKSMLMSYKDYLSSKSVVISMEDRNIPECKQYKLNNE
jgi:hypothetical protein